MQIKTYREIKYMISVIVPVYNVEKYLEACLDSIRKQTYCDLEIILIDDGSIDKSGEICDMYCKKDSRIKVIHKSNGGLGSARNKGIDIATGEYICFIDSDDTIDMSMLYELQNVLTEENADMIKCNFYQNEEDKNKDTGKITVYTSQKACQNFLYDEFTLKKHMKSTMTDALYKTKLFKQVRFREDVLNEDTQIFPQIIFLCDKIIHIDKSFYYYRENIQGIMHQKISKKKVESLDIWADVYKTVNKNSNMADGVVVHWLKNLFCIFIETYQVENENERNIYQSIIRNIVRNNKKLFFKAKVSRKLKMGVIMFLISQKIFIFTDNYLHFCS